MSDCVELWVKSDYDDRYRCYERSNIYPCCGNREQVYVDRWTSDVSSAVSTDTCEECEDLFENVDIGWLNRPKYIQLNLNIHIVSPY